MTATSPARKEALACVDVSKTFGGTRAVKDVTLHISAGTIHSLVGENGAGKSTLLGVISGRVVPSDGQVSVFGHPVRGGRPRELRELGLASVHQELMMYPSSTALENVFAGQVLSRFGFVRRREMRERFDALCELFDVQIRADAQVSNLSVSHQQVVEIMRGVQSGARVILLDEPTAALAEHERETLHRVLKKLAAEGTTIVLISHNLDEVLALSDTISVMRDGTLIATEPVSQWTKRGLIAAMIGRELVISDDLHETSGELLLDASHVSVGKRLFDVDLQLRSGEIVGVWGLVGSGRTTFMRAVSGSEPRSTGSLRVAGKPVRWPKRPAEAISSGVVMVPEDRKSGLVLSMDAVDNYWLGRHKKGWRQWLTVRSTESGRVGDEVAHFGLNPGRVGEPVGRLSGGNQQKVMLTKWAGREPKVFLIDEPTRGIDVGAKSEVLAALKRLSRNGAGVVMTSSELEEVLAVSHRLLVFAGGRVVAEIARDDPRFNVEQIVRFGFQEVEASDVP